MEIVVIGPNLRDQSKGSFHVHAAGCADIKRNYRQEIAEGVIDTPWEAQDRMAVVASMYGLKAGGFYDERPEDARALTLSEFLEGLMGEFHFAPCVNALPLRATGHLESMSDEALDYQHDAADIHSDLEHMGKVEAERERRVIDDDPQVEQTAANALDVGSIVTILGRGYRVTRVPFGGGIFATDEHGNDRQLVDDWVTLTLEWKVDGTK